MSLQLINSIEEVRKNIKAWKKDGLSIGLVPTMGALHKGHSSLVENAKQQCDKVVVSIFVNPIQFCKNEDFDKYPRTIESDFKICSELGVDIVFAPTADEMYGINKKLSNDELTFVCPSYNFVDCMCGKSRIGHFDGVATVVTKLFNIVQPDYAFFGQKDAQQLFIIEKMVADLNMDIKIIPCPIVREEDGLALSSRNIYLSQIERQNALTISKALKKIKELYSQNVTDSQVLFDTAISILHPDLDLDYLEFRDFKTLEKVDKVKEYTLVAIAAKSGKTRLIDNIIL